MQFKPTVNEIMNKIFLAISIAVFGTACTAAPLGTFPDKTMQLCKDFHGIKDFEDSVGAKDLPCLQSQVQFLLKEDAVLYEEALAKAKNKAAFKNDLRNLVGTFEPYEQVKDDPERLLDYRMDLTNALANIAFTMVPEIKYPRNIVEACNTEPEGNPWGSYCLMLQSEYWEKGMQANLKKLEALLPDSVAFRKEQEKWEEGLDNFCTCNISYHVGFSYYDLCVGYLKIYRAFQIEEMVKALSKDQKKTK